MGETDVDKETNERTRAFQVRARTMKDKKHGEMTEHLRWGRDIKERPED